MFLTCRQLLRVIRILHDVIQAHSRIHDDPQAASALLLQLQLLEARSFPQGYEGLEQGLEPLLLREAPGPGRVSQTPAHFCVQGRGRGAAEAADQGGRITVQPKKD